MAVVLVLLLERDVVGARRNGEDVEKADAWLMSKRAVTAENEIFIFFFLLECFRFL